MALWFAVEMERLAKHHVFEEFPESEYDPLLDGEIIEGRWVNEDRGEEGRSRVVAKHSRRKNNEEVKLNYAGTPDMRGFRCMMSLAAEDEQNKMVLTDAGAFRLVHDPHPSCEFLDEGEACGWAMFFSEQN